MKKVLCSILCIIVLVFLVIPKSESNAKMEAATYEIEVNGQNIDVSKLPYSAYKEGDTMMVPLQNVAKALGYKVTKISKKGEITIEDSIQKAVFRRNSKKVKINGKLEIIDLSREVEYDEKIVMHKKTVYVPLEIFEEFGNQTSVDGININITTIMCEIQ